jgi:AraC-like DNA-binding protein
MTDFSGESIKIISGNSDNSYYAFSEQEKKHTPYETEVIFYGCIERGDIDGTEKMLSALWNNIVVGRMSHNDLRQMQYFAVCCITLGIRAVIRGGVPEINAYNISDEYIQKIDSMKNVADIAEYLSQKAVELARLVAKNNSRRISHPIVKKAAHYISENLYQKITTAQVADYCSVSKDHLSLLFKQNTGDTTAKYILKEKLGESKRLINRGLSNSQIAYQLGFCSESHFIAKYKECYGNTPGEERKSLGKS